MLEDWGHVGIRFEREYRIVMDNLFIKKGIHTDMNIDKDIKTEI